jgi:hypothetical protein
MFEGMQLFDDQMIMFEGSKRVITGGYCWHRGLSLAPRVIAGTVVCCRRRGLLLTSHVYYCRRRRLLPHRGFLVYWHCELLWHRGLLLASRVIVSTMGYC